MSLAACAAAAPARSQNGAAPRTIRPCPSSPNCVSTESGDAVLAFRLAMPARDAWPRVRAAVLQLTRCRIADESPTYLRAECTSLIFRFVDDLEIELREPSATLAVRSASRVGYSDLGVNRRRLDQLRTLLIAKGVLQPQP